MAESEPRRRLDEILLSDGTVSESEIREALYRQKSRGGKFGSHLLYHRHIDEATLVRALATQFGCEGVVLSEWEIPAEVAMIVPKKIALARHVIAFEDDPETNTLKIACEDPTDPSVAGELAFAAGGRQIKLYVAAESAIEAAIARHYEGKGAAEVRQHLLEIPDELTRSDGVRIGDTAGDSEPTADDRTSILLVSNEAFSVPLVQSLLERERHQVTVCESVPEAIVALGGERFHAVLISQGVSGDPAGLIDLVRKSAPRTLVRLYDTVASLLLNDETIEDESDLLLHNLELFTSLLSSRAKNPINHGGRVAKYASRLCQSLGLPDRDRLMITNAAYVHDLARYYYGAGETSDKRHLVGLTVKLLASLGYPADVLEMLRTMYRELSGDRTTQPPVSVIGGNVLTIADLFCDSIPADERLSFDKFDAVKKTLRDQIGRLLLPEVVEVFIELMAEEVLDRQTSRKVGQVMIHAEDPHILQPMELRLRNEGYRTVSESEPSAFVALYKRSTPDMMVLALTGTVESATSFVGDLAEIGVTFSETPTFLLANSSIIPQLTELLQQGIEDIIALDDNLDLLVTKIHRQQAKLDARARAQRDAALAARGAQGRLADMNLIDLLQALGPGRKTVRLTVHQSETETVPLTIYLNEGELIFAEFEQLTGADAVYEGLTWTVGTWMVEPVPQKKLPSRNNEQSNESILMEGLRLVDEKVRAGQLL